MRRRSKKRKVDQGKPHPRSIHHVVDPGADSVDRAACKPPKFTDISRLGRVPCRPSLTRRSRSALPRVAPKCTRTSQAESAPPQTQVLPPTMAQAGDVRWGHCRRQCPGMTTLLPGRDNLPDNDQSDGRRIHPTHADRDDVQVHPKGNSHR